MKRQELDDEDKGPHFLLSSRFGLAVIAFFGAANVYALRVNLSVALVCMVNNTAVSVLKSQQNSINSFSIDSPLNGSNISEFEILETKEENDCDREYKVSTKKDDGSFVWGKQDQGLILSSFFYGYMVTQLPGGMLAERFGGKHVFLWVMLTAAIATLFCPLAASLHVGGLAALRIIIGLCEGFAFPCLHSMWSKWCPPLERSILTSFSYAGAQVGIVLTFPIAAHLCSAYGWESVFYVFGSLGILWCVCWFFIASSTPIQHKRISPAELRYILASQKGQLVHNEADRKKRKTPWLSMATSMPVWAIIVGNTTANFGTYLVLTTLPTFMKEVLRFSMKSNGLLSAIPYIAYFLCINSAGQLSDFLRRRNYLSTTNVRKLMMLFALCGQAIFLVATGYCECGQESLAVLFITIAQGISGFQYGGFIVNHVDIAPSFAGTLLGISNTFGTLSGIVAPVVAAALTKDPSREAWRSVFWVAAVILVAGTIFYAIFGSGKLQPWATPTQPSAVQLLPLNQSAVSQQMAHDKMVTSLEGNEETSLDPTSFQNQPIDAEFASLSVKQL